MECVPNWRVAGKIRSQVKSREEQWSVTEKRCSNRGRGDRGSPRSPVRGGGPFKW